MTPPFELLNAFKRYIIEVIKNRGVYMKKLHTLLLLPLIFFLVACGKAQSAKDEFITRMESQQSAKKSAYEYTFQLDDISSSTENFAFLESYIGKEIKATISQDLTKNVVAATVDLASVNPSLSTFNLVYVDDKAYISAAPFLSMYGLSEMDAKGKYMDLGEMSGQTMPKLSELTPNSGKNATLFKEIDAKKYTKDGDKVTVRLSIEEMFALTEKILANGGKETKEVAANFKEQAATAQEAFAKDSYFTMTIDPKNNGQALLNLVSKSNKKDSFKVRMTFKGVGYKAPTLPKSSDILSQEDLMNLFMKSSTVEE